MLLVVLLVASIFVLLSNLATRHVWTQKKKWNVECEFLYASSDSKRILCMSMFGKLTVIDLETGHVREVEPEIGWKACALTEDGNYLAAGAHDGTLTVWKWDSLERVVAWKGCASAVRSIAFCGKDDNKLASTAFDGVVSIWDWSNMRELRSFRHGDMAWRLASAENGSEVIVPLRNKDVYAWRVEEGHPRVWKAVGLVRNARSSPDDSLLLMFVENNDVQIWERSKKVYDLFENESSVMDAIWTSNKKIAVIRSDGIFEEIDIESDTIMSSSRLPMAAHVGILSADAKTAIVTPDGKSIALFERPPEYIGFWSIPGPWLMIGCFLLMILDGWRTRSKVSAAAKEQASAMA
jgi:WD40 repeat protein